MTTRRRSIRASLLACTVVLGACRSSSDSTSADATGVVDPSTTTVTGTASDPTPDATSGTDTSASATETSTSVTGGSTSSVPDDGSGQPETADADELVLSDGFEDESDTWGETTWDVDVPGEASATVIDGVGVMQTDLRGTDEWVRALAPGSTHVDASLLARITPVESSEGTVFVGLHGDGEWRDASPYMPQSGVVVEYSYADIFDGEIVLIVLDGPDERRIGPVLGPVLSDGQSANIRFEIIGDHARVKVWRTGDDEPIGWDIEGESVSPDGGVVQIAYRDGVGQSVAWDELSLLLFP